MDFKTFYESSLDDIRTEQIEKAIPTIQKECQPYLKLMKKNFRPFFRGIRASEAVMLKTRRKDRKPKDTWYPFHLYINQFLKENKTIPRSEGIFARLGENVSAYGEVYYMLPVGKFDFYYLNGLTASRKSPGPLFDLTTQLEIGRKDWKDVILKSYFESMFRQGMTTKDMREEAELLKENDPNLYPERFDQTLDLIDSIKVVKNKNDDTQPEYVINCDKYYAVHKNVYDFLEEQDDERFNLFDL